MTRSTLLDCTTGRPVVGFSPLPTFSCRLRLQSQPDLGPLSRLCQESRRRPRSGACRRRTDRAVGYPESRSSGDICRTLIFEWEKEVGSGRTREGQAFLFKPYIAITAAGLPSEVGQVIDLLVPKQYCGNSFEVGFPTLWHSITLGFQLGQGN
jgi:hypothetical protein